MYTSTLLKMGRYYNTTMRRYWDMLVNSQYTLSKLTNWTIAMHTSSTNMYMYSPWNKITLPLSEV